MSKPITAEAVTKILTAQRHGWRVARIGVFCDIGGILLERDRFRFPHKTNKAFLFFDGTWSRIEPHRARHHDPPPVTAAT